MGLGINVGVLVDLIENDPEGEGWFREDMRQINLVLSERGLPAHVEPESLPSVNNRDMRGGFPYSFLHYLRRFYAYVKADSSRQPTPILEGQHPFDDPFYQAAIDADCDSHLICHSDAEGYYLPIDFDEVIFEERVPGGTLGSSARLIEELLIIAPHLDIPLTDGYLDDKTAALLTREEYASSPFWVERVVWLAFYESARLSIEHKTAIQFG